MKLQKASRYGLYAVLELARDPGRQLSAADIAGIYDISTNHLAKVLRDLGYVKLSEPFDRLLTQGMVLKDGAKMAKSKGNIVAPDFWRR